MESNFILSTNRKPVSGIMCIDSDANTGITAASDPEPQIQVKMNQKMSLMEKLGILSDAAKYDVSCSSSGVSRRGDGTGIGNTVAGGICHRFGADGRCISLLKILFTNECIYDCRYCINRHSNDVRRAPFTPAEIWDLPIRF